MISSTVFALALATATASPPAIGNGAQVWGGQQSCATWLSDEQQLLFGKWWIWGFWSGLNGARGGGVGHSTDAAGLVGEIKLLCEANPSEMLIDATFKTYAAFEKAGR